MFVKKVNVLFFLIHIAIEQVWSDSIPKTYNFSEPNGWNNHFGGNWRFTYNNDHPDPQHAINNSVADYTFSQDGGPRSTSDGLESPIIDGVDKTTIFSFNYYFSSQTAFPGSGIEFYSSTDNFGSTLSIGKFSSNSVWQNGIIDCSTATCCEKYPCNLQILVLDSDGDYQHPTVSALAWFSIDVIRSTTTINPTTTTTTTIPSSTSTVIVESTTPTHTTLTDTFTTEKSSTTPSEETTPEETTPEETTREETTPEDTTPRETTPEETTASTSDPSTLFTTTISTTSTIMTTTTTTIPSSTSTVIDESTTPTDTTHTETSTTETSSTTPSEETTAEETTASTSETDTTTHFTTTIPFVITIMYNFSSCTTGWFDHGAGDWQFTCMDNYPDGQHPQIDSDVGYTFSQDGLDIPMVGLASPIITGVNAQTIFAFSYWFSLATAFPGSVGIEFYSSIDNFGTIQSIGNFISNNEWTIGSIDCSTVRCCADYPCDLQIIVLNTKGDEEHRTVSALQWFSIGNTTGY